MAQLRPRDRIWIVHEGKKQEEHGKVNIAKLARDLQMSWPAVQRWWDRRDELDETGQLDECLGFFDWKIAEHCPFLWDTEFTSVHHNPGNGETEPCVMCMCSQ